MQSCIYNSKKKCSVMCMENYLQLQTVTLSPSLLYAQYFFVYYAFEECSKRLPINAQSITTAIITRFIYYLIIFMTRLA